MKDALFASITAAIPLWGWLFLLFLVLQDVVGGGAPFSCELSLSKWTHPGTLQYLLRRAMVMLRSASCRLHWDLHLKERLHCLAGTVITFEVANRYNTYAFGGHKVRSCQRSAFTWFKLALGSLSSFIGTPTVVSCFGSCCSRTLLEAVSTCCMADYCL